MPKEQNPLDEGNLTSNRLEMKTPSDVHANQQKNPNLDIPLPGQAFNNNQAKERQDLSKGEHR